MRQTTNTTPAPEALTNPIELVRQKIINDGKVMLDTLNAITSISNPLQPFYENTPDYNLYKIANQWTNDCIAFHNSLITLCQQYPEVTRQDNMQAAFDTAAGMSGSQRAVSQKMMQYYFQLIEQLPIPPADTNPINHLIHRMLQPNAAKRITASEALQVIEEYRTKQNNELSPSRKKRERPTQDNNNE